MKIRKGDNFRCFKLSNTYVVKNDYEYKLKYEWELKENPFFSINKKKLIIKKDFPFDGVTGGIDTECLIRASCVHDILTHVANYSNDYKKYRKYADEEYYKIAMEDGADYNILRKILHLPRYKAHYIALRIFGRVKGFKKSVINFIYGF